MRKPKPLNSQQGYNYALRLLQQRPYSEAGLYRKLALRSLDKAAIEEILQRLKSLGLVDDERYAEMMIRSETLYRHASPRRIQQKLVAKGINKNIIESQIAQSRFLLPDESTQAMYHAKKYYQKYKMYTPYERLAKTQAALYRKGFTMPAIRRAISELGEA